MSGLNFRRWASLRPKVTIGRMMIAVAVVAAFLPAFGEDIDGKRLSGALIVAACTLIMTGKLAVGVIARERSDGLAVTWWRMIWIGLGSWVSAVLIIVSGNFLFLFYGSFLEATIGIPPFTRRGIDPIGIILSLVLTVLTIYFMRRAMRPRMKDFPPLPPAHGPSDHVEPEGGVGGPDDLTGIDTPGSMLK